MFVVTLPCMESVLVLAAVGFLQDLGGGGVCRPAIVPFRDGERTSFIEMWLVLWPVPL